MRINRLELHDYKCFEHLVLEELGDKVVLVGPNGSGKSAILEAIVALKEFVATYNPNVNVYHRNLPVIGHGYALPENIPSPIRGEESSATVKATLSFDESEVKFCHVTQEAEISICIEKSGKVTPQAEKNVVTLFRHFDPDSGIGVIDYISPHRTIPLQKINSINIDKISTDRQRIELIEFQKPNFDYEKFKSVKQFIFSEQLADLSYNQSQQGSPIRDSLILLKQLFKDFFGPKVLLGYGKRGNEMQVQVITPYGTHDIDQLSSGEKELFSILVSLFRIRNLPSVILYDEPERHLNASLEAKIMPAIERLNTKNQIWIATHGIELIGSTSLENIIELDCADGYPKPIYFRDESKQKKIRLFETLGAKVGLQLATNKIVFVEGKESHADKSILERLIGAKLPGVLFVASGPSTSVMSAGTHAALLIEEASKDASFLMVLDRDYKNEENVEELKKKGNDRVFVWDCHEIENIMLNPEILLEVLRLNSTVISSYYAIFLVEPLCLRSFCLR